MIAFHGMLIDSKDVMPRYTGLNETAKKHQFMIAYPNAVGGSWGLTPDKVKQDLAFFDALLAKLTAAYRIDPDRVYVLGMSNGGYFAHLVTRERAKTVAARGVPFGTARPADAAWRECRAEVPGVDHPR